MVLEEVWRLYVCASVRMCACRLCPWWRRSWANSGNRKVTQTLRWTKVLSAFSLNPVKHWTLPKLQLLTKCSIGQLKISRPYSDGSGRAIKKTCDIDGRYLCDGEAQHRDKKPLCCSKMALARDRDCIYRLGRSSHKISRMKHIS